MSSISSQDYDNFEVVVVDDCSSDRTAKICRDYSDDMRILINEHNLGLVGNHNRCICLAQGRYVKFVHADDYLLPGAIAQMVAALESHPEAVVAFSRRSVDTTVEYFLRDSLELHSPLEPLSECNDSSRILESFVRDGARRNLFGEPTSVMFNRELAAKIGGFSTDLPQLLDLGLWLALLEHGDAIWIDEPLSVRVHTYETATESNRSSGIGSLDKLRIQLSLTRSPKLSRRYRVSAGRLAATSFIKALGKAVIHGPLRANASELSVLARQYITGDVRSLGEFVIPELP